MTDVLVPIVFFAFLAAIIIVPQLLKSRDRAMMYETMRAAYEKGQPVPPELVEAFTQPYGRGRSSGGSLRSGSTGLSGEGDQDFALTIARPGDRDLRRGVILLSVGVGLVLVGAAFYVGLYADGGASEAFGTFAAAGAIPGCMGLAHLGLWWFSRRKSKI